MGNEVQNIGGVSYANGTVKDVKVTSYDSAAPDGTYVQKKRYRVSLTDGTIVHYDQQPSAREASIAIREDGAVDFSGLFGAKIVDTEKDDVYRFHGCEYSDVLANRHKATFWGLSHLLSRDVDKISFYNRKLDNGQMQFTGTNQVNAGAYDHVTSVNKPTTFAAGAAVGASVGGLGRALGTPRGVLGRAIDDVLSLFK